MKADDATNPMALTDISSEIVSSQQRQGQSRRLTFTG